MNLFMGLALNINPSLLLVFTRALSLTLVIEGILGCFLSQQTKIPLWLIIIVNLVLNPLMNLGLLTWSTINNGNILLLSFELIVILLEGTIYSIVSKRPVNSFLFSFFANGLSLLLGIIIL